MAQALKKERNIAPEYPGPLELVGIFSSREEANLEAWEWRAEGFYAHVRTFPAKNPRWGVYVREGRIRPAPEPLDPTLNYKEQRRR